MKIALTQPCDNSRKEFNLNAIRNTRIFLSLLTWAKDPAVKQPWIRAGLLNPKYAETLHQKITATREGQLFKFTLDEAIELYTCIDICCRFYLSPIGEQFRNMMITKGKSTAEKLEKEKRFTLGSSTHMIAQLKEAMKEYPRFKQAVAIVNKLEIPEFESELMDGLNAPNE